MSSRGEVHKLITHISTPQLAQKRKESHKLQRGLENHEEFATMMLAAQTGNVEQIKQLLKREVNVNEVCIQPEVVIVYSK